MLELREHRQSNNPLGDVILKQVLHQFPLMQQEVGSIQRLAMHSMLRCTLGSFDLALRLVGLDERMLFSDIWSRI